MTNHRITKKKLFVYSIKSYCVLKMSKNKKEIRYILKFYYKKGKMLKKFVMFIDMMQYQYVRHKADSSVFNLEILKMHFALIDQLLEKSKMEKIERDCHISNRSHDIDKKLKHRPQNSFKPFGESWIEKINSMFRCHMI